MYRSHFGLNQSPFGITPNPAFFYSGSRRGDILEALIYAVTHGEGIIKVTGEVGSGKTMLCRMLESMMPASVEVIYLVNPTLSREEVVFAIAGELEIATGGKRPDEVIRLLHHDLITKHVSGKQVVLLVEEAQAMPLETLEEIRLFSNLETAHHKLLQIVLFGQPELDENLNLPRMRQLKERITHSFKVPPMTRSVIPEFLMFRMRAAGYHGPDIFTTGAIKQLAAVSEGIVRRINILADKSLLAAFADSTHSIQARHVKAAIRDSEFSTTSVPSPRRNLAIGLMLAVAAVIAADIGWRTYGPDGKAARAPSPAAIIAAAPSAVIAAHPASEPQPAPAGIAAPAAASAAAPITTVPPAAGTLATAAATPAAAATAAPVTSPAVAVQQQASIVAATANPAAIPAAAAAPAISAGSTAKEVKDTATANRIAAAPAVNLVAGQTQASPAAGILQQRVAASREWLRDGAHDHYTIQIALLDAGDAAKLEGFLKRTGDDVGIEQLHLYPTRSGGKPRFGVVYSSFSTRDGAVRRRIELARKWDYRLQLRTIGGLRDEIMRSQSADLWPK